MALAVIGAGDGERARFLRSGEVRGFPHPIARVGVGSRIVIFAIFSAGATVDSERRRGAMIVICCAGVIILVNMMAACGGGGGGGGPQPQTYEITITGASGSYQHLTSVQLVVD